MRMIFCDDHRFVIGRNGGVYSPGQYSSESWEIPLMYFEEVVIYARRAAPDVRLTGLTRCDRPGVRFRWISDLSSLRGVARGPWLLRALVRELHKEDVVVARLPSHVGLLVSKAGRLVGAPVAAEVVACIWDGLRSHGSSLARLYAPVAYWLNRRAIERALFVRYVTRSFLQGRYPTRAPSVALSDAFIVRRDASEVTAKYARRKHDHLACAFVGPLFHRSKGLDVAIYALAVARGLGARARLSVAGPGGQAYWRGLAERLGVGDLVTFEGVLSRGEGVRNFLDRHDVLLLPSRQEGLSRVAIEAMARGLPVLASTAGGNSEIVPSRDLHRTDDFDALARRIRELDCDRPALAEAALEALSRVEPFLPERSEPRWRAYYSRLAELAGRNEPSQPISPPEQLEAALRS